LINLRAHYPFWILLLILILQRIVVLFVFNANYTDNDQTLIWLIAKDYSEGNFHQPFMYGQDYNYMVEALLAVPLLWCKVPVEYALPIVANLLAIAPFASFAFWFKRKERNVAAMLMLAIPLLLPISYSLITSLPRGFINGLAFFAFWPWIENIRKVRLRYALYGFILTAGFVTNANVIFIAVFLGGLAFFQTEKKMQFILFILVGASIPALLHLFAKVWISNHLDQVLHRAWNLEWTWEYFKQALAVLPLSFFKGVVPFTENYAHILWFVFPALCFYAFWEKKYPVAVLLGVICIGVIFSFGINKVNDGTANIFYPASRMFLALPLVLALTCAMLTDEIKMKRAGFIFLLAGGIFAGVQLQRINAVISAEVESVENVPLKVERIDALKFKVEQLHAFALSNSISHFAGSGYPMSYGEQQNLFHAGESWFKDFPNSALPEYERRAWRSEEVLAKPAKQTAWMAGTDGQWMNVDTTIGPVTIQEVLDYKLYRIGSDTATNLDVWRALTAANGLLE